MGKKLNQQQTTDSYFVLKLSSVSTFESALLLRLATTYLQFDFVSR